MVEWDRIELKLNVTPERNRRETGFPKIADGLESNPGWESRGGE